MDSIYKGRFLLESLIVWVKMAQIFFAHTNVDNSLEHYELYTTWIHVIHTKTNFFSNTKRRSGYQQVHDNTLLPNNPNSNDYDTR